MMALVPNNDDDGEEDHGVDEEEVELLHETSANAEEMQMLNREIFML